MADFQQPTGVVPYLAMAGRAREAMAFWGRAFGAKEMAAYEEKGHIRHAEVQINGGMIYVTDFSMEPLPAFQPTPSITLHIEVPDGSEWMAQAKAAGCRVLMPWQNIDGYGAFGRIEDPFGVIWSISSPKPA